MPAGVQYLALLRGINVGGKNLVKMADLRLAFEDLGLADVATYIQTGNVFFRAPRQKRADLAARIEAGISRRFGAELKIVVLTEAELRGVVAGAPRGFRAESLSCDVIFLRKPLTANKAFGMLELKEGVDEAHPGKGVVYFSRVAARASSSRLSKVVALPEYQDMTIRSWTTTTKLLATLDSRAAAESGSRRP